MKSVKSITKFSEKFFYKSNNETRSGVITTDKDKIELTNNNNKNKLHEFNLNSNSTQKNKKEKELENIISNINLQESMTSLQTDSSKFRESELLNDIPSLNSYIQSPEKKDF